MTSQHANPSTHADEAWKLVLDIYFPEFMQFFFPALAERIDWNAGFETKDKELEALSTDAMIGKRLADMLVKVQSKEGNPLYVLVHSEVQGEKETDFPLRLYIYHYRIYDRYQTPVITLAILADERRNWRPERYQMEIWGQTVVNFRFHAVKLLDYKTQETELLEAANPFGIIVAAHLAAQKTRKDPSKRYEVKFSFIRRLYDRLFNRGFTQEDIRNLYRFIEWVMALPEDLNLRYHENIREIEARQKVEILTGFEKIGMQKGLQQGKLEAAKDLLKAGVPRATVIAALKLSEKDLAQDKVGLK